MPPLKTPAFNSSRLISRNIARLTLLSSKGGVVKFTQAAAGPT